MEISAFVHQESLGDVIGIDDDVEQSSSNTIFSSLKELMSELEMLESSSKHLTSIEVRNRILFFKSSPYSIHEFEFVSVYSLLVQLALEQALLGHHLRALLVLLLYDGF